ncbi:hypothetical protein GCM10027592_36940 [Spirosoma flavus]
MYFFEEEDDEPETVDKRLFDIKSCLSTTINLSLLDLTAFPDVVFDYPQVTILRIGTIAPATIGRLPERIHELTNLEELNLMGQQLTELPESLCDLPKLKRLYLSRNQLTKLPKNLSRLRSLVCLDVRNNPIQAWPDGFWEMPFIGKYQNDLKKADERETELLLQRDYNAARELRQEALRWGLHW